MVDIQTSPNLNFVTSLHTTLQQQTSDNRLEMRLR